MSTHPFSQLDVFADAPLKGNPLAVVHDADGLTDAQMAAFARWTNLSETTFLLKPVDPAADYRVRIFSPGGELRFAGHPTLGSCHAWLSAGGTPRAAEQVVQECGVGLVRLRTGRGEIAFAAPPMADTPIEPALFDRLLQALGLDPEHVQASRRLDNGLPWHVLHLDSAERVLAVEPDAAALARLPDVGLVGAHAPGQPAAFELRAFAASAGVLEDPVTGSLNAAVGQWLIARGAAPTAYRAAQGARLGRAGRISVAQDGGTVWVGGPTVACIQGQVTL